MMDLLPIITGLIALAFTYYLIATKINPVDTGTDRMGEISGYIADGAMAFIRREYMYIAIFSVTLLILLAIGINYQTAVAFAIGTILSALAGFIGMRISTRANVRTASAAMSSGMNKALSVAFGGGAVMGMSVVGLGFLGVGLVLFI